MSVSLPLEHTEAIHPALRRAISSVVVADDGTRADVAGRTVSGTTPRDLRGMLANAIYEEFHAGNAETRLHNADTAPRRDARDASVESRFADGVPHATTRVRGRLVRCPADGAGDMVVRLPEITALMPAGRLLAPRDPQLGDVVEVAVEAARPALSPGFFYVMGSRPLPDDRRSIRRIFLHALHLEGAVALWSAVLPALESVSAQYHAKVVSSVDDLPRRDGVVIYLHGDPGAAEALVVETVAGISGTGSDTSLFVDHLAPGVGAAWDPRDPRPGHGGLSFGQHRSLALATALVDHAVDPAWSLDARVAAAFRAAGINPLRPADNLT